MCRGTLEKGTRRCPCDTSANRQARRVNQRSMAGVETKPPADLEKTIEKNTFDSSSIIDKIPQAKKYKLDGTPSENVKALHQLADEIELDRNESIFTGAEGLPIVVEVGKNINAQAEHIAGFSEEELNNEAEAMYKKTEEFDEEYSTLLLRIRINNRKKDYDEEQMKEDIERRKQMNQESYALQDKEKEIKLKRQKFKEAQFQALKELRGGEFGVGEEGLTVHDSSTPGQKKSAKILETAIGCYPRSWIEASNAYQHQIIVKEANSRAHYKDILADSKEKVLAVKHPVNEYDIKHMRDTPTAYAELTPAELKKHNITPTKDSAGRDKPVFALQKYTMYDPFYHGQLQEDGMPKGRGWKKRVNENILTDGEPHVSFYKTKHAMKPVRTDQVREIKLYKYVGDENAPVLHKAHSTAIHEFAHRCEDVMKVIPSLENAFIKSRAKADEKLTLIRGGRGARKEVGYADSFNNVYTGRIYYDRRTGEDKKQYYEVLSTGIEGVFGSGTYVNKYKRGQTLHDTHLRDFTLGVLGTVNRK